MSKRRTIELERTDPARSWRTTHGAGTARANLAGKKRRSADRAQQRGEHLLRIRRSVPGTALALPRVMAKLLIAYLSREGQTTRIVQRIGDRLAQRGHECELVDLDHDRGASDPSRFDAVVLAAPIYAGGYPHAASTFAKKHREALARLPCSFVSVGLAVMSRTHDGKAQTRQIVDRFLKQSGLRPRRVELVAGALLYTRYNFLKRWVMRRIVRAEGGDVDTSRDYEYTDWAAVDAFAAVLAQDVETTSRPQPAALSA
jgi:menaquinone-dependent protoporphyrinogen oxidase